MALFTDSNHVTEADLIALDPEIPSIISAEGVSSATAIALAWDRMASDLSNWLEGQGGYSSDPILNVGGDSPFDLGCVVASGTYAGHTSQMVRSMRWRSLENLYRSASARKSTDRMREKMDLAKIEADACMEAALRSGVPVVYSPLPSPGATHDIGAGVWGAANVSKVTAGAGGAQTVYVAVTWTANVYGSVLGADESGPSEVVAVSLLAGETVSVSIAGLNPPGSYSMPAVVQGRARPVMSAAGWRVYVGPLPSRLFRQASTPIPVGTTSYALATAPVFAGQQLWPGQVADEILQISNLIERG